jgi:hypothetical protein
MKTDYKNLSESQVKALLIVASESGSQSPLPSIANLSNVERLLTDMSRTADDSHANVLETATKPTTSVQELTRIKGLAKALMKKADDNQHLEAARLLYHVSVAAAFVHHDVAISGRPMQKQQFQYERLAETWSGHPVGRLFREAAARVARDR